LVRNLRGRDHLPHLGFTWILKNRFDGADGIRLARSGNSGQSLDQQLLTRLVSAQTSPIDAALPPPPFHSLHAIHPVRLDCRQHCHRNQLYAWIWQLQYKSAVYGLLDLFSLISFHAFIAANIPGVLLGTCLCLSLIFAAVS
jgi:hypothetical protein